MLHIAVAAEVPQRYEPDQVLLLIVDNKRKREVIFREGDFLPCAALLRGEAPEIQRLGLLTQAIRCLLKINQFHMPL